MSNTWSNPPASSPVVVGGPEGVRAEYVPVPTTSAVRSLPWPSVTAPLGHSPVDVYLRWLLAMDDPADAGGVEARRTVTLTEIIRRARLVADWLEVARVGEGTAPAPSRDEVLHVAEAAASQARHPLTSWAAVVDALHSVGMLAIGGCDCTPCTEDGAK